MINNQKSPLFSSSIQPLWVSLRPSKWEDYYDFSSLKILYKGFKTKPFSFLLYGPPGCGKTTFIDLLLKNTPYHYEKLAAASCTLEEIRKLMKQHSPLILFMDEIHRFAKSRQDFFLKPLEEGSLILIGATTQSPFYYLTSPLLSRLHIKEISLPSKDIFQDILKKIWSKQKLTPVNEKIWKLLSDYCYPDFRRAYQALEYLYVYIENNNSEDKTLMNDNSLKNLEIKTNENQNNFSFLNEEDLINILKEYFRQNKFTTTSGTSKEYDLLSAFIKSVRGSDSNASLLYLAKLLDIGTDISILARRLVILASEDIGLANSQAFVLASEAFNSVEKIGMPEARIILSHVTLYLALSPKSNSAYKGINSAMEFASYNEVNPPAYILNHSKESSKYKYPHNTGGFVKQNYWPKDLEKKDFYNYQKEDSIFTTNAEQKLKTMWENIIKK